MEDIVIQFKTAVLAKEKGFDWRNIEILEIKSKSAFLDSTTQSLLQKWLREIHQIDVTPVYVFFDDEKNIIYYDSNIISDLIPENELCDVNYYSKLNYKEALEEGIYEGLKLIKL